MTQTIKQVPNVVIIGASHAAVEVISTLRKCGWEGTISLIGDEPEHPYQRPPLSKGYYNGDISLEKLAIKHADFYESAGVDLYLGLRANFIDRTRQNVTLDNGQTIAYDHLIIATGTRARTLTLPGSNLPCIHYLRTKQDVDQIKNSLAHGSKLLIIGAGYIGLEVAASAIKQDIDVTIIEAMDRVLARVTSPVVSEFYQSMHAKEGVYIRLNTALKKFDEANGKPFALLNDGEKIEFDCAIVGIGVIPNIELAEEAQLDCNNGIVVDEFTRTTDPLIHAIGDCSNHPSQIYQRRIRLESVPNAIAQAKTAAKAICGEPVEYNQLPWFWSDQFDVKLQTAGLSQGYDHYEVSGDLKSRKFSVSYYKNDQLIALDALNSPAEFMKAKKQIAQAAKARTLSHTAMP